MLTEDIKNEIMQHANTSNMEVCGLIKKIDDNLTIEKKENLINSATEFLMDFNSKNNTIAYYHSHIKYDQISEADKIVSERLGLTCIVYNKSTNTFHQYDPQNIKIKYTGRPFVLGFADCSLLVQDYYFHDLNIKLASEAEILKKLVSEEEFIELSKKRFIDEGETLKNKDDYLKKYFEYNGFREVTKIKKNDVLICRTKQFDFPIHCLIYLGENKVLHHPGDGISKVESLSSELKKWVIYVMRHNIYD
jgi:proteasome lid subunit RPN8/RPN11